MKEEYIKKNIRQVLPLNFHIYPDSLRSEGDITFFIVRGPEKKYLGIIGPRKQVSAAGFIKKISDDIDINNKSGYIISIFGQNDENLDILTDTIPSLKPVTLGTKTSFGFLETGWELPMLLI